MDYPNLRLEPAGGVAFGACLSDTTARRPLLLTNTSAVDVAYVWEWDPESLKEDNNSIASMATGKPGQPRAPRPRATQLFDVLPTRGVLRPGESAAAVASFFAYPGVKASATALCQVTGGPTYHVSGV
jgi:hydrocephalus-inducing protein